MRCEVPSLTWPVFAKHLSPWRSVAISMWLSCPLPGLAAHHHPACGSGPSWRRFGNELA